MDYRRIFSCIIATSLLMIIMIYTIYINSMSQDVVYMNQQDPKQRAETKERGDKTRVIEQIKNVTSIEKEIHLKGKCKVSFNCTEGSNPPFEPNKKNLTFADIRLLFPEMKQGGSWSPEDCDPGQKVAIIIPYRDREDHLKFLLANIIPFLKIQKRAFTIFVIEQAGDVLFNRACLMNIGYIEALKLDNYTCFIFHDVDMIPIRLCNLYECSTDKAMHLGVSRNVDPPKITYPNYLGGVLSLHKKQVDKINGFTNLMFGWGKEDDEAALRLKMENITIHHRPATIGNYVMPKHKSDPTNPDGNRIFSQIYEHVKYRQADGLSSLKYTFKETIQDPLYTKIVVDIEGPKQNEDVENHYIEALQKVKLRLTT